MPSHASLVKEPSASGKVAPAPKTVTQSTREKQEPSLDEVTHPTFTWNIGDVSLSAPGENGRTNPADGGSSGPYRSRCAKLPWPMQAKLEIGTVDDPLEREADRVAHQVMRMPEPAASTDSTAPGTSSPLQARSLTTSDTHSTDETGYLNLAGSTAVQRQCSCGGSCTACKAKEPDDEPAKVQRKPAALQISEVSPSP